MAARQKLSGRSAFYGVLACALVVIALATLAFPLFVQPKPYDHTLRAKTAVTQLTIAIQIYLMDSDNVFPPARSTSDLQDIIYPYIKDRTIFDAERTTHNTNIQFNVHLSTVRLSDIPDPAIVPTLWTPYSENPEGPVTEYYVAYADLETVRLLKPQEAATIYDGLDRNFPRQSDGFLTAKTRP